MEDWAEIRRLRRLEGSPIKAIVWVSGSLRNTVGAALGLGRATEVPAAARVSIVDAVEPRIRELLRVYPTMPATLIAERIGWDQSIRGAVGLGGCEGAIGRWRGGRGELTDAPGPAGRPSQGQLRMASALRIFARNVEAEFVDEIVGRRCTPGLAWSETAPFLDPSTN